MVKIRSMWVCVLFLLLFEVGCASWRGSPSYEPTPAVVNAPYNQPYRVGNITYQPITFSQSYVRMGNASWYGKAFHGKRTSNGEIFNQHDVTAASKVLPIPSYARVVNLDNGKEVVVRVNDRGPFAKNRILDLSWQAARLLGCDKKGLVRVKVTYLRPAPPIEKR